MLAPWSPRTGAAGSSTRSTRAASRTRTATGWATCAACCPGWTTSRRSASTSCGCRRSTARRWTTTATTSATTRTSTRCSARSPTSTRCSPRCTRAGCGSSWTSSSTTPPTSTRGSSSRARAATARSATGTGGATPGPAPSPARPAPSRPTGSPTSPARRGSGTRRRSQYYLHLFSRRQPDLNWENPEVRQAVYAMMRWWLDRGVDGFRMDVVNMLSKDLALPDAEPRPGSPYGPGDAHFLCGPRIHEFLQEMHREVFAGRDGHVLTVGEMPGVTLEEAVLFTDPERRELDMVFQFEHVSLDHGDTKFDLRELSLPELKASLARWQAGLADRGWNSLYWGNHDQPRAVSRYGDDGEHRVASAKALATVLHLHRGTPYVYQGDELGMRNAPFAGVEDYRDIESLNAHAAAQARGRRRPRRLPRRAGAAAAATTRARRCSGTPPPAPGSPPARPGSASTPTPSRQRGRAGRRPRLGLRPPPPAHRPAARRPGGRPTATSRCCCPTTRRSGRSCAAAWRPSCSWRPTCRGAGAGGPAGDAAGRPPTSCSATCRAARRGPPACGCARGRPSSGGAPGAEHTGGRAPARDPAAGTRWATCCRRGSPSRPRPCGRTGPA